MIKRIAVIVIIAVITFGMVFLIFRTPDSDMTDKQAAKQPRKASPAAENKQVPELGVNGMTLDEKIGQMIFSGVNGTEMTAETKEIIDTYHVGGIILFGNNIESKKQTVSFLNDMKAVNADNPFPLLLGVDEEGGSVTRMPDAVKSLPTSRSIGKLNDPDTAFKAGTILGEQMQALGFNLDFAPVLDINSNPDNPVIDRKSVV